ncbi:MAG: cytidine deaminase [Kiritimatiellae bacterium]|nr:cytidine deaminase [Kiritimatiellia bacterium]
MTNIQKQQLIKKAVAAMRRAYAPYSRFCVGAALLTQEGRVFQGCNVENASYGLTLCAERTALGGAITAGHRHFTALAVVSSEAFCGKPRGIFAEPCEAEPCGKPRGFLAKKGGQTAPMPCGACLQALAEFCRPDFVIITAAARNPAAMDVYQLTDLLPRAFRLGE